MHRSTRDLLIVVLTCVIAVRADAQPPRGALRDTSTAPLATLTPADSLSLLLTIFPVALSNGTQTAHAATPPELVCVAGPGTGITPDTVLAELQRGRTILVRPSSACISQSSTGRLSRSESMLLDTLTGKRGIRISAGVPIVHTDGTFVVETGYYQHGLSSAGWTCQGRRQGDGRWTITTCTMNWIS